MQSQLTSVTTLSDTSTNTSGQLLGNVSMDSELSIDFTESSVDISEFEDTPRQTPVGPIQKISGTVLAERGHPDYLELESVTPVTSSCLSDHHNSDILHAKTETLVDNQNSDRMNLIKEASSEINARNSYNDYPHSGNPHGGSLNGSNPHSGNPHGGNPHGRNAHAGSSDTGNPRSGNPNPQGTNPGINGNPHRQGIDLPAEKLIPAHLKPAKEKLNNSHTKETESGEATTIRSPTSPSKQPPRSLNITPQVNSIVMGGDDSDGSTPDEDYQTPSTESVPLPGEIQSAQVVKEDAKSQSSLSESTSAEPKRRQFEAFYVDPDSSLSSNIPLGQGARGVTPRTPVTESFTLHDQYHTIESARAAGLPIVDGSAGHRLGELSSGESSDPELQKLRADHSTRETEGSPRLTIGQRPELLTVKVKSEKVQKHKDVESPKTNFAQIKQEKENGDLSSISYGTKNQESGFSLKSQFQKGKAAVKVHKKTTFAALPNQTTWQENAVSATRQRDSNRTCHGDMSPTSSELVDIKMRLEERRRQIENEKRRMEMQWTKQRQRLGKQAFIQVINRGKSETDLNQVKEEEAGRSTKVIDADERLSSLIKSRDEKTPVRPAAIMKGSSAPASREQSLDREQSVPSPAVSKMPKPVRSQTAKVEKAFTTGSSQEKLSRSADSAKELFSEGEPVSSRSQMSPVKCRPKSYHAPDTTRPVPVTTSVSSSKSQPLASKPGLTSSTEKSNLGNYSSSLDRLNSSLSELQGEIMRLSLQQDQIKSLVVHEREPPNTSQSPAPTQTSPSHDDKYYLYPKSAVGEPDIISAKTEAAQPVQAVTQVTQPNAGACVTQPVYAPSQQPAQLTGVQYANQPQPPYATVPSYPTQYTPFVGSHPQPGGMYALPQQFTGIPQPQYQATNVYQTPQMYQQQMPGYSGIPQNHWHPGVPPISHPAPAGQSLYNNNTFQPALQAHTITSVQSPIQRTAGTPDYSPDHHYKAHSGYSSPGHSVMAHTGGHSQLPSSLQSPVQPPDLSSPTTSTPPDTGVMSAPEHLGTDKQYTTAEPHSEGYFVGLDDGGESKPVVGDKAELSRQRGPSEDAHEMPPNSIKIVPQYVDISPVGFVVGDDHTDVNVSVHTHTHMHRER